MRIRQDQLWNASEYHIPCLAHVVNLAVQAFLTNFHGNADYDNQADEVDAEDDDDETHETGIHILLLCFYYFLCFRIECAPETT